MNSQALIEFFNDCKNNYGLEEINLKDEQAVLSSSLISNRNAVGFLPTGFGKSLVYLIPAIHARETGQRHMTIVVSPLKALMDDQIDTFTANGFRCCKIEPRSEMKAEVIEGLSKNAKKTKNERVPKSKLVIVNLKYFDS